MCVCPCIFGKKISYLQWQVIRFAPKNIKSNSLIAAIHKQQVKQLNQRFYGIVHEHEYVYVLCLFRFMCYVLAHSKAVLISFKKTRSLKIYSRSSQDQNFGPDPKNGPVETYPNPTCTNELWKKEFKKGPEDNQTQFVRDLGIIRPDPKCSRSKQRENSNTGSSIMHQSSSQKEQHYMSRGSTSQFA